jgi:hypothetical protein
MWLSVETANQDVHSVWADPSSQRRWRLVWALKSLKDTKIISLIPDFMTRLATSERDIELISRLPETSDDIKKRYGVSHFCMVAKCVDLRVAEVFQPTCTSASDIRLSRRGSKTFCCKPAQKLISSGTRSDPAAILTLLREHLMPGSRIQN